ncbi:hypothetical protein VHEMI01669 [[Torrubiella] hemipterigena]|uniref:FluG domain-containing protein n=1 Tax=[Torrubiella] hemipterigena TaxID=1531966 RepID=A0A0A1SMI2_9HYPO|nr:hypothetical protein VHEMI01669 [[Torrubiella] hemipterigena]
MLFQVYTACRPAELVDGTKRRGTGDPLLDEDDENDTDDADNDHNSMTKANNTPSSKRQKTDERRKVPVVHRFLSGDGEEMDSSSGSKFHDAVFDSSEPYDTDTTIESDGSDDEPLPKDSRKLKVDTSTLQRETVVAESEEEQTRRHKAICYEDIVLWIVKDAKHGGRDMLAMEVFLRHHKGADRKPKPTIFLFRENPLPILCPISHILARAMRDEAIEVDGYSQARPFFSTQIGKKATKVQWKSSVLNMPLFRKSRRIASGGWVKSFTEPMKYSTYAFYLNRIGWDLGSDDKWTTYCLRRGNANALLGMAPDAVVDQVMRHDPMTGCLANAYLNQRVGFNTQDAYLERDPTADDLTKAFTHMSIRCNPEVPREIPAAELNKLPPDPDAVELAKETKLESIRLRQLYGFIKLAPKKERESYKELQDERRNVEKIFKDHMTKVYQEAYRRRMHNEELEKQPRRERSKDADELTVEHHLEERRKLQAIICDFRTELSAQELADRKVQAIDTMALLASRREVRPPAPTPIKGSRASRPDEEPRSGPVTDIPLMLRDRQCIYCVSNDQLPIKDRMRSFKRVSHMMDHVENLHLRYETIGPRFLCRHPKCKHLGDFLTSLDHFKNHMQTVHGVKLRK